MAQGTGWLGSLLRCEFMGLCSDHQDKKDMFCIDCRLEFCKQCEGHSQHRRLQIYRHFQQDSVLLEELQNHLGCSEIQTFMANGKEFVSLKSRPQFHEDPKPSTESKTVSPACEACGKSLIEPRNRFCSNQCKLSFLHVEQAVSSSRLGLENYQDNKSMSEVESPRREPDVLSDDQTSEVSTMRSTLSSTDVSDEATTSERTNSRSEKKGIPRRAPLS